METLALLGEGFALVLQPMHLLFLVIGLVLGLLVAVLPGLTLVMGVVLALPFTYGMGVLPALILLTAMYVSGTYGGAFTSILFRIPGEPLDVPLLWDGYPMARAGQPALALGWTLVAALAGGLLAGIAMVLFSAPVAKIALSLSTPEFFAVIMLGFTSVVALGGRSLPKALVSLGMGLLFAAVGTDPTYGEPRFEFGIDLLGDGIEFLLIMIGAYGLGEVLSRMEQHPDQTPQGAVTRLTTELPTLDAARKIGGTFARGSIIGFLIGIIPGAGATIASFVSYGLEKQYGKRRDKLGTGIAEGIVAPQSAATASVGGAMVPLLTMGIPGSGATAIIMAAFMLHGIQPGPNVFFSQGEIIYAVFAAVIAAVLGMCVLGYFAIRILVRVMAFPEALISAFVVMFCFMGAMASRSNPGDLWILVAFGILGYLFEKTSFPIAPMVLGAILGPLAETNFMTTMISFSNDWTVFFTRPLSGAIMAIAILALVWPVVSGLWSRRRRPGGKVSAR